MVGERFDLVDDAYRAKRPFDRNNIFTPVAASWRQRDLVKPGVLVSPSNYLFPLLWRYIERRVRVFFQQSDNVKPRQRNRFN